MLGVRYGRLALAKLSSRRYEDRALEVNMEGYR